MALFSEAKSEKWLLESSVGYFMSKVAAQEIKEFSPDARIVIMLRKPVDLVYSLHSQLLYTGNESIQDFEAALEAEPDRRRGNRIPANTRMVQSLFYSDVVKFADNVGRYVDVFGSQNVHVATLEELKREPSQVFSEILRFLGLPSSELQMFDVHNANTRTRNQKLNRVLRNPPRFIRFMAKLVPEQQRRKVGKALVNANTVEAPRAKLSDAVSKRLQKEYLPQVKQLEQLLGREFRQWYD